MCMYMCSQIENLIQCVWVYRSPLPNRVFLCARVCALCACVSPLSLYFYKWKIPTTLQPALQQLKRAEMKQNKFCWRKICCVCGLWQCCCICFFMCARVLFIPHHVHSYMYIYTIATNTRTQLKMWTEMVGTHIGCMTIHTIPMHKYL